MSFVADRVTGVAMEVGFGFALSRLGSRLAKRCTSSAVNGAVNGSPGLSREQHASINIVQRCLEYMFTILDYRILFSYIAAIIQQI